MNESTVRKLAIVLLVTIAVIFVARLIWVMGLS